MYKNLILALSIFTSFTPALASKVTDPELIIREPAQTTNNMGANFPNLGAFEESFIGDVRLIDLEEMHEGNVLLLGDGYGRLGMRVLRETNCCNVFINDLSDSNLAPLRQKLRAIKDQETKRKAVTSDVQALNIIPRAHILAGDCLQLPFNKQFISALGQTTPYNSFQTIACTNMIHFFDGEQMLKFFVHGFNLLSPGGSLHLMSHVDTRMRGFTEDELLARKQIGDIYAHVVFTIKSLAQKDGSILFSGI